VADSKEEIKTETQADDQNPPETKAIVLRNQFGAVREQLRGPGGTFVKKPKPLIPTLEFTRAERKALMKAAKDGGMTEYMKCFMNMVRIAQYDGDDAKAMMAAVKAFEALSLRALGKPAPSEQELNKLQVQPFKIVYIPIPEIMNPAVQEYKPVEEKTQPSFADAEVIQQN
jgi:hypothetical protein